MNDSDLCPVCLDPVDAENHLAMPGCGHRVHVVCALSAAQYDPRCPVCRCRDARIVQRASEEDHAVDIFRNIEAFAARQNQAVRSYNRRRSRAIQRRESLRRMRDKLKMERRSFCETERELERTWNSMQRHMWTTDATIVAIKARRARAQRRITALDRRLSTRLEPMIGVPPDPRDYV